MTSIGTIIISYHGAFGRSLLLGLFDNTSLSISYAAG